MDRHDDSVNRPTIPRKIREIASLFLKIGATTFGGPAALIAVMQRETVNRRHWIDDEQFLDLVGAVNLIPGPNATEMALYLGMKRAGWRGYLTAGLTLILPGLAVTLLLAWIYVTYGSLPQIGWVLYGIKPVVIAIVIHALWNLGKVGIKGLTTALVGAVVLALSLLGINEILLLFAGAAVVLLVYSGRRFFKHAGAALLAIPLFQIPVAITTGAVPFSQLALFLSFLKIGAVIYGSGYVLLAFLKSEFVVRLGWLTSQQVLDAVAVGQITPGPFSSSAAFIGYLLGGWQSALLAALGIFLPSFILVALLGRFLPVFRKSPWAGAFLDGVNVAALGLMGAVSWTLGRAAIIDWFTIILFIAALFMAFRFKFSAAWFILGGGVLGVIYKLVAG